jgi:CubicO group peptidase (beta-lactamase class C family)
MLLGEGALDGVRILGRKTLAYMTSNHLPGNCDLAAMGQAAFAETPFEGIGFGLGFSVVLDPVAANVLDSPGEFAWGGAASTYFFVDPREDLVVVFMTQLLPSSAYPIRRQLKTLVYQALVD